MAQPMSDDELALRLTDRLVRVFDPRRVVWFGSRAEGRGRADSDFDLMVVAATSLPLGERLYRAQQAVKDLGLAVDVLVLTPEEHRRYASWPSSVVHAAEQSGRILFEAGDRP